MDNLSFDYRILDSKSSIDLQKMYTNILMKEMSNQIDQLIMEDLIKVNKDKAWKKIEDLLNEK